MQLSEYYAEKAVYQKIGRGRMRGILTLAGDLNGRIVLDIGCGGGELGKELKKRFPGVKVYGIDISPSAVREAAEHLDGALVLDLTGSWPQKLFDDRFDLIVVSEVLEHLFKPEALLMKIRERFDCPVIVTVPNLLFWKNRLKIFFGYFDYVETGLMDRGHIHFFSWRSFGLMFDKVGYQVTAVAHHLPTRGTKLLAKIWPGLWSYQFIVRLEKK